MNVEETKRYYDRLTAADLCDCAYCRNYVREIRAAYPDLAAFLDRLGADIEKPFEAIPAGAADGTAFYSGVQYVLMGKPEEFAEAEIGNARVFVTDSHPMTDVAEEHFVIEISPVTLKWTEGERDGP